LTTTIVEISYNMETIKREKDDDYLGSSPSQGDFMPPQRDYMPPSPPQGHYEELDLSRLKQLAEISLATAGAPNLFHQSFFSSLLYPSLLNLKSSVDLTPSSSPSPPPAHHTSIPLSPLSQQPSFSLYPPQDTPIDLRVISRKLEFPETTETFDRRHSIESQSTDCQSDASLEESEPKTRNTCHECPECGRGYSSSSNLARHRQSHRSPSDLTSRSCPHCDKVYVSTAAFSMHVRTHTEGCKCPFCGKSFSRPWLLQGHIRTHTGEKPFTCNVCNKSFADKSNLRAHVQTHSTDKSFSCERCGKAFALKSYLSKHKESSCMKQSRTGVHLERASSDEYMSNPSSPKPSPSSQLVLSRLLSTPSLIPSNKQISEATLQALRYAVAAHKD